ncbi:hypothetical protein [Marinibacterium sp. SX1]|uniref:hypothetical protein n=1 Tax=Marinibacterium sp. SX1 TaxID=3388424 RepID=UPI003D163F70
MSFEHVILRVTADPADMGAGAFARMALSALAPVIRPLNGAGPGVSPTDRPALVPVAEPAAQAPRDPPFSCDAALFARPFGDAQAPGWMGALAWPSRPEAPVCMGLASLTLDCRAGDAMVEITLPLFGWPLTDYAPQPDPDMPGGWSLAPVAGAGGQTADRVAWAGALAALNAAMSGMAGRFWAMETTGIVDVVASQWIYSIVQDFNRNNAVRG